MKGIFDSDRHVIEPISIWENYVEPKIYADYPIELVMDTPDKRQDRIQRLGEWGDVALPPTVTVGGMPVLSDWSEANQIASAHENQDSLPLRAMAMAAHSQLQSMNDSNIGIATLYPTFAGFIVNHENLPAQVSVAYAQAYNRWLYEYSQGNPERLRPVGLISRHDPEQLISQLDQIMAYGWKAITVRPEVIAGRSLGHEDYEPFWAACEDHGIAVSIHGSTNLHGTTVGSDRFSSRFGQHACSHPMEIQMAFLALLESGVLERHPNLKFGFLEAGAAWIPHWLWRLDNICYPEFSELTKHAIKQLPSEYFRRQCWVTVEIGEPCLGEVIKWIGEDKVLYGTDFPHPDHLHLTTNDFAQAFSELSTSALEAMLYQNGSAFYGYDCGSLSLSRTASSEQDAVNV